MHSALLGSQNLFGGASREGTAYIWDTRSSKRPWKSMSCRAAVKAIIPLEDPQMILTCNEKGTVSIWDLRYAAQPSQSFDLWRQTNRTRSVLSTSTGQGVRVLSSAILDPTNPYKLAFQLDDTSIGSVDILSRRLERFLTPPGVYCIFN